MYGTGLIDHGRKLDWGRTSSDYAVYRPGPPASFYEKLKALDIGLESQAILDLGTGTGVIAREFAKRRVSQVCGTDISILQIETAKALAKEKNLQIDFRTAAAENQPFPDEQFDVITANQCWLYFDQKKVIPEVHRLLKKSGVLMVSHFSWLPRRDETARQSEKLILKFNPQWTAADYRGEIPAFPTWAEEHFRLKAMFYYDELIPFTAEAWRGRIRACRGIGAALSQEEVKAFDQEHAELLRQLGKEKFSVLHRIDAHIFEFKD